MPIFWKKIWACFYKNIEKFFSFLYEKSRDFIASMLQIHAEGIKVVGKLLLYRV